MKLVRPGIVLTSLALAIGVPLGAGAAASSSGVQPTTGTISGVVNNTHGAPLAGVCVAAWDSALNGAGQAQSASTGAYSLTNIFPGVYSVVLDACQGGSAPDVQAQNYDNTQAFGSRTFVTVVAGQTTQLNPQVMQPGGDITIQVTDSHGAHIPNLRVAVIPAPGQSPQFLAPSGGPSTADGSISWHFDDLMPIDYVIEYMDCPPTASSCVEVGSYHGQAWNSTTPTLVHGVPGSTIALTDTLTLPSVAITVTTMTASPNTTTAGQPVTLTATVTTSDGSAPTGSVDFATVSDDFGQVHIGSNGTASVTTTAIPIGTTNVLRVLRWHRSGYLQFWRHVGHDWRSPARRQFKRQFKRWWRCRNSGCHRCARDPTGRNGSNRNSCRRVAELIPGRQCRSGRLGPWR